MSSSEGKPKRVEAEELLEMQKELNAGYISLEDLRRAGNLPPDEIVEKGIPVPIFDCLENIPCTPCHDVCPTGAVVMETMNDKPKVIWEKCTGCTLCAQACPGLAITIVYPKFGEKRLKGKRPDAEKLWLVSIPYEMLPIPKKGEKVRVYDRGHRYLCDGEVYTVIKSPRFGTVLVNVLVPGECAFEAKYVEVMRDEQ